jgi:hypothetical protein
VRVKSVAHSRAAPVNRGALKLLNNIYRKEKLAQRLAVLQSAGWLIDIPEKLASTL